MTQEKILIKDTYNLSPMQEGILFETLYENKQSGIYIEQLIINLQEEINVNLLNKSWQIVIDKYSVLRTSIEWKNREKPIQKVFYKVKLPFQYCNLETFSSSDKEKEIDSFLKNDRIENFQLTTAPLMRLKLFKLNESNYKLIWSFHHIILDGRSFTILLEEVFKIYRTLCQGTEITIIKEIPYKQYIAEYQIQDEQKNKQFWQNYLKNFKTPLKIDINNPHKNKNEIQNKRGIESFNFNEYTTKQLQDFVKEHNLTLNSLFMGIWAILLSRYTNEEDIIFGAVKSCRHGYKSLVGLSINTLPIRVIIKPNDSIISLLKNIRQNWINLRQYEKTSLSMIQKWSELEYGNSLFNTLFVFEKYQLNEFLQCQDNDWKNRKIELQENINYPLVLGGYVGKNITLKFSYDGDLYSSDTIRCMMGHFRTLLTETINDCQQKISQLNILTEAEKQQILIDWNNTKTDYPKDKCIHQLFEEQVVKTPENIAVVFEGEKLTYKQLNEKANQLAHYLQKLGVKSETLLGICVEKSLEMIIGILGILKAGGAYIPIDINYPQERLEYMLKDSQTSILLTQEKLVNRLQFNCKKIVKLDKDWDLIKQENKDNLLNVVESNNLVYAIYTSGSTGTPKGVMIEHISAVNIICWRINQLEPHDFNAVPFTTSISFDLSVIQIFPPLIVGGKIIIIQDLSHFETVSHQEKITYFSAPPSTIERYIIDSKLSENIEAIGLGAEKVSYQLIEKLTKIPHIKRIYNSYGPTETTVGATSNLVFSRLEKENNPK